MPSWIIIFLLYFLNSGHVTKVESKKGFGLGEQEWGYVKVREEAHMFWWLYYVNPAPVKPYNFNVYTKPLIIWLQGGPGSSSTGYGNFAEIGPLDVDLQRRNNSWVNDYNVLFIDNPVGTGFSFVESKSSFATTNLEIAKDLVTCITEFLEVFPGFKNTPTYIVGESYGGKMAAEFTLLWYQRQSRGKISSNLKGVTFIDSLISPIDRDLFWSSYLYNMGMVDKKGREEIQYRAEKIVEAIESGNWSLAYTRHILTQRHIVDEIKNKNLFNILEKVASYPIESKKLNVFMNNEVKKALGLNTTWGASKKTVKAMLAGDKMKPVTDIIERLLNETNLQVIVTTGQLDSLICTPSILAWVEKLRWAGATKWYNSARNAIIINDVIEGYVKNHENFKVYWVNRAGHMAPKDNPVAFKAILQDLTS